MKKLNLPVSKESELPTNTGCVTQICGWVDAARDNVWDFRLKEGLMEDVLAIEDAEKTKTTVILEDGRKVYIIKSTRRLSPNFAGEPQYVSGIGMICAYA